MYPTQLVNKTNPSSYLSTGTAEIIPGQWRLEIGKLRDIEPCEGKRSTTMSKKMRFHLREYFNNEGAVPWEYKNLFFKYMLYIYILATHIIFIICHII